MAVAILASMANLIQILSCHFILNFIKQRVSLSEFPVGDLFFNTLMQIHKLLSLPGNHLLELCTLEGMEKLIQLCRYFIKRLDSASTRFASRYFK